MQKVKKIMVFKIQKAEKHIKFMVWDPPQYMQVPKFLAFLFTCYHFSLNPNSLVALIYIHCFSYSFPATDSQIYISQPFLCFRFPVTSYNRCPAEHIRTCNLLPKNCQSIHFCYHQRCSHLLSFKLESITSSSSWTSLPFHLPSISNSHSA